MRINRAIEAIKSCGDDPKMLRSLAKKLAEVIASDELIQFSFAGPACNDVIEVGICHGWDGVSERCYCGNRRVEWLYIKSRDEWEGAAD